MSRYVHDSGRDDAQLNNQLQSRFPNIPGFRTAGQSRPSCIDTVVIRFWFERGTVMAEEFDSIRCGRASA